MAKGIELATAYVSLAIESSDLAKTIGTQFGDVERRVAPKAGKSIGKAMAKGFEAEAPDLTRLERDFEDAQKRIVQAEERATTEQENLARKVEIAQQKKTEAVEKYGEESSQALTAIDRLIIAEQKLEAASMKAEDEQRKLNLALEDSEKKLKAAKDETDDLSDSAEDSGKKWGRFKDSLDKALTGDFSGAFDNLKKTANQSADDVGESFTEMGSESGTGFSGKFSSGVAGAIGGLIAAAGIGTIISDAIFDSMDDEKNADRMQASLGLSEADAQAYADIVSDIYSEGWGSDKSEVQSGIESFLSWSPELKADSDALDDVTTKALALSDAFALDVADSAQIAGQMVMSGLAGDTAEALDLLAAGMQKVPVSLRDEYTDAIQEYAPHLASLGFTGEHAFSLLASSAEMGQYGIDKTGDAMKEFAIRATDGSKASEEAYDLIGLKSDEMANAILAGGDDAAIALGKITNGLLDIEDPAEQAEAAIALFGTPLEDLGVENIPEFLEGIDGMYHGLGDVDGRAQDVADTLSDNTSTEVEKVKRGFSEWSTEIGDNLIVKLKDGYEWIDEKIGPVIQWLSDEIIPPVVDAFTNIWETLEEEVFPALQELWRVLQEDLGPSFTMFKDLVVLSWDLIWGAISLAWDLISGVFTSIVQFLSGDFSGAWETIKDTVVGVWDTIWNKIKGIWNDNIYPFLAKVGGWFVENLQGPIETVVEKIGDAWNWLTDLFKTPINWIIDYVINGAVRPVVNTVASALGLDWQMGEVSRIAMSSPSRSARRVGGPQTGGTLTSNRAFADGGFAAPGWALVGEEGPELVNFLRPGRVYTADETAEAFRAMTTGTPGDLQRAAGSSPASSLLPMGDNKDPSVFDRIGGAWSDIWRGTWSAVTNVAGKAIEFVRGALGDAAALALNPVKGAIRDNVGIPFVRDGFINRIDSVINWVKGVDEGKGSINGVPVTDVISPILEDLRAAGAYGSQYADQIAALTTSGSARPVTGGVLTSLFGPRWGGFHAGIDWAVPVGTPVRAWRDGVITNQGWDTLAGRTGFGKVLAHAGGFGSYYGHLSRLLGFPGDRVRAGDVIGYSGNTGNSTGPHLHFEISKGGPHNVVNPLRYLFDSGGGWSRVRLWCRTRPTGRKRSCHQPKQMRSWLWLRPPLNDETRSRGHLFSRLVNESSRPTWMSVLNCRM
ncbi:hypothetical protein EJ997_10285 [Flaviflexus ciconiae]|uniref:Uncharacterized protein n=1 Tax=Flaviflexus ciconiae TaxID=2496867 RepID=A0A3Q9G586_9ACTO|nr:peptidoglycan DD-metalloendopeptidase family protein [Flaviflexus ciconiae]AZQ77671.1 hypothetical protein EJ997_10285 [Flaviflexus ciconiae]